MASVRCFLGEGNVLVMKRASHIVAKHWRSIAMIGIVALLLLAFLPGGLLSQQGTAHAAPNAIQLENAKEGSTDWNDFASDLTQDTISGYGSKISVNHGESLDLYVTTTAGSVSIDVFRVGWYGGLGARKIVSLGSFPGVHQVMPTPDPVTGIVVCQWTKTTTLNVPADWVTGVYLAKLTASSGKQSFIYFVVRNDGGHEDLVVQTSVTTYQAYNTWGGTSLYNNYTNQSIYKYPHATKVSFDRPFNPGDSNGAGHFFWWEYKFVRWAELQGYDVTYITDVDTHTNVNPLTNHKAFLSVGHDEYWSKQMRDNVESAINAGVNAAFFSANTAYWQIRFEPNATGIPNRIQVGYKDFATADIAPGPDPYWHVNDTEVTTLFRDPPVNRPENGLLGVMFEDQVYQDYTYVVQNSSSWVYAGSGFTDGSTVTGIVGYEYDKVYNNGYTPAGLTVLSSSPVTCCGGQTSYANSTIYTAASGARVFASGTIQWSLGLDNSQGNTYMNAGIQRTTANLLNNFIGGTQSGVTLTPSSVSFGNQNTGTTSAAQALKLTNNSAAAVNISSVTVNGTNASDFTQTNTCGSSLAVNASCTVNVTFKPGAAGSRSATLTITDNAVNSPQSATLTGTGVTPTPGLNLNPTSVTFNTQNIGTTSAAQSVTLTNNGTAALTISGITVSGTNASDFAQTNTCGSSLAANASCTVSVTFKPTVAGTRSANVTVTSNAPNSPQSVALSGTGNDPSGHINYFSDDFESGTFSKWTLGNSDSTGQIAVQSSVVNSGNQAAALTNSTGQYGYLYTALTGTTPTQSYTRFYFRLANATGSILAAGRNATNGNVWEADYNPYTKGLDVYIWGSGNQMYTISSAQNVINPNTWYSVEIGTNLATAGKAEVWLNGQSIGSVSQNLTTSSPYARLMLYNGAVNSIYYDDVLVSDSYNGQINTTPTPGISLQSNSLIYGNQNVSTSSSAQSVTLTNTGTATLTISTIAVSGTNSSDFAQSNTCGTSVAAGASCTINVTFTPSSTGSRSANVTISNNAANSPHTIALSGTGVTPTPGMSISPTSLSFGQQGVNTSSPAQAITVTNTGTAAVTINSIAVGGTNTGDFSQSNTCGTSVAVGASCAVNVTFKPTATGTRNANITITSNAPNSPQTTTLSGSGVTAQSYFSDDFESGNTSKWTYSNSDSTGKATVQTTTAHGGTHALSLANTSGQYSYVYTSLPSGPVVQSYTRFYFRLNSLTNGSDIAIARNENGSNAWEMAYNQNSQAIDVFFWTSTGGVEIISTPTNGLAANTWYSIEVQDNQASSGHVEVWLNGTSVGNVNGNFATTSPYSRLMLFNSAASTFFVDDLVVSSGYNGPTS
jgi:hypothetical protein